MGRNTTEEETIKRTTKDKDASEKDMFEEYEFKYTVTNKKGETVHKSTTIKKWSLRKAGPNVKKAMSVFVNAKKEVPDLSMQTIIENIPVILANGIEDVMDIIENTLDMNSNDKSEFMDSVDFDRVVELGEAIVKQNFLSPVFLKQLERLGLNFQASESDD